jgi:hypothetical protein
MCLVGGDVPGVVDWKYSRGCVVLRLGWHSNDSWVCLMVGLSPAAASIP